MSKRNSKSWSKDLLSIIDSLTTESNYFWTEYCQKKKDIWRRAYVRSVFSEIEAVIFCLKRGILEVQEDDYLPLTDIEQKSVNEFYLQKDSDGKQSKVPYYLPFTKNLAFTLELYACANYVFITIDKKSRGWQHLVKASKIRNRIMHPKIIGNLVITDVEMQSVRNAEIWFKRMVLEIMKRSLVQLAGQIKGLKKVSARLTSGSN